MKKNIAYALVLVILLCSVTNKVSAAVFIPVGTNPISEGQIYSPSIAIATSNIPYVAYSDAANNHGATMMKYQSGAWSVVGSTNFSNGSVTDIKMTISPDNIPYVVYRDIGNSGKATVMKYQSGTWSVVGSVGISSGTAYNPAIAVDANGIIYIVYTDNYNNSQKATVMKYDGSWTSLGAISTSSSGDHSVAIDSNNIPYFVYTDNAVGNKLNLKKYESSTWSLVGSAGFSSTTAAWPTMAIDSNNIVYVAYGDDVLKTTVMKYDGSWSVVGSPAFSAAAIMSPPSLAIDSNNVPYVVYSDNANSSKATMMKYINGGWTGVGTTGFSSQQITAHPALAIDSNNIPYVIYSEFLINKAVVMKYTSLPVIVSYTGSFDEGSSANNGSVTGSRAMTLVNDTFINAGGTLTSGVHYSLTNKPAGLIPVMAVSGDGTTATLTFTGKATNHLKANSVSNLTITFLNGAFTNTATSSQVENYTDNSGSISFLNPMPVETIIANQFHGGGVAQGWHNDDDYWQYTLPFNFTFFDSTYNTIYVGSNGYIGFSSNRMADSSNAINISGTPMIAAIHSDLRTDVGSGDIFITNNSDGKVIVRWLATEYDHDSKFLNFEVVLKNDNNFQINYGDQTSALSGMAGVGVGDGNGLSVASIYNGNSNFNQIQTSSWGIPASTSTDVTKPVVTSFTIPATSTSLTVPILTFSATDDTEVTGYLITASSSEPAVDDAGWSVSTSTSYTFGTAGSKTLYAWTKDAAVNISLNVSSSVTIALPAVVTSNKPSAGSSIFTRYNNLVKMGNQTAANELVKNYPLLFKTNTNTNVDTNTNIKIPSPRFVFNNDLKYKDSAIDVRELQKYLNSNGFVISVGGPGSVGNESMLFGVKTRAALIKYQISKGIKPAVGFFGPLTRKAVNGN